MPGQLNAESADGGARGRLQQPFTWLYVEFARHQEQRGQRVDGELTGSGVAQVVGGRQDPSCIGNKVFLPRAGHMWRPGYRRDSNGHHALADLQSLSIRAQSLNPAHAFHVSPDSGKFGGESVAATQHVQITGVNRSRLHADQRLPGFRRGDRAGFQPQDIGRLTHFSGYERAHGSWHE
ncbi:hypothetical protein OG530_00165 [Streptomyces decoyicus]